MRVLGSVMGNDHHLSPRVSQPACRGERSAKLSGADLRRSATVSQGRLHHVDEPAQLIGLGSACQRNDERERLDDTSDSEFVHEWISLRPLMLHYGSELNPNRKGKPRPKLAELGDATVGYTPNPTAPEHAA
jgi:hypothetical protein